jgi:ubiquitin carboxyl-terminal hydrolase L3
MASPTAQHAQISVWFHVPSDTVSSRQLTPSAAPDSDLAKLLNDAIPLKPIERADLLYDSEALESAHQSAATGGDTSAPAAEDNIDLHYVCFVKSQNNNLWELDGRRKGPLNRGKLSPDEDVLSEKALDLGVRSFLKRESAAGGGDLRFSLITLAESLD